MVAWLRQIVVNTHRMSWRSSGRMIQEALDPAVLPSRSQAPDQIFAAAELRRRFIRGIAALPAILRVVFELRVLAGLSTAATAQRLSITPEAVRTRLSRARRAIDCA